MKQFIFLLACVVVGMSVAKCVDAAVTISGPTPTQIVNGGNYIPVAGDVLNVSKNGAPAALYTITSAMATAGAYSFVDSSSSNCTKDSWIFSYTSLSNGLTSAMTGTVITTIDGTGCAVKFVPGTVK